MRTSAAVDSVTGTRGGRAASSTSALPARRGCSRVRSRCSTQHHAVDRPFREPPRNDDGSGRAPRPRRRGPARRASRELGHEALGARLHVKGARYREARARAYEHALVTLHRDPVEEKAEGQGRLPASRRPHQEHALAIEVDGRAVYPDPSGEGRELERAPVRAHVDRLARVGNRRRRREHVAFLADLVPGAARRRTS